MKQKESASFTVEAALVMPIVIYVIYIMLYFGFYFYDICAIQAGMDRVLNRATFSVKHGAEMKTGRVKYDEINDRGVFFLLFGKLDREETEMKAYLEEELQGLLLVNIQDIEVKMTKFTIHLTVKGDFDIPIKTILMGLNTKQKVLLETSSPIHNPAELIRISNVVIETGSKIKGVEQLKEYLKKWKK